MEYLSISYACPFPAKGQPREVEAVVAGPHGYERFLIYLAANVYPGRTDLHMGGKTLWSVSKRELPNLVQRGALILEDLPLLPKDYVWKETTGEERILFARRKMVRNTLNALFSYRAMLGRLERALTISTIPEINEIVEVFYTGVGDLDEVDVESLDRLLALLVENLPEGDRR